jgi:exonuclease SbcD
LLNFIIRTDVHISEEGPRSRKDDYLETVLGKLDQIADYARQHKADAVLDNGDFFHLKSPGRNSHRLIQKVAEVQKRYPCPTYVNPGNHDLPYGNIQHLDSQPLGVMFATGVFHEMKDIIFEDALGLKVRVIGLPYKPEFHPSDFDIVRGDEDYLIVAAHTYASMEGGEQFGREIALSYKDLSLTSPDVFIFGHWHEDQGIECVRGKHFFNLGSLTRGSLSHDNITKQPRVGLLSISYDGISCEALPIQVAPSSEVFDLQAHSAMKKEEVKMQNYLDSMKAFLTRNETGASDLANLMLDLDPVIWTETVRQRALEIMEEALDEKILR